MMLLSAVSLAAEQPAQFLPIWPASAPNEPSQIGDEHEQPLRPGDTTIRVANVSKPTITLFRPPAEKRNGACVVVFPGGGYNILAWNKEGTEVAEWLNGLGVTAVVLKYRVPARQGRERYAAPLQDAQRAVGLVRHRASQWGVDPQRIGVLGFSAGGHLAATLCNNYAERTYEPLDEADKTSCRPDFALLIYPAYLVDPKTNVVSPELNVTEHTPATFIAQSQDDGVRVEGSLFYYLALKNAKVPAEMHLYPSGGHGYGLRASEHLVSTWPQRAADWMRSRGVIEKQTPAEQK
jgi:acetyl esterase/lipase